jgi:cystathionine gamma-synthase
LNNADECKGTKDKLDELSMPKFKYDFWSARIKNVDVALCLLIDMRMIEIPKHFPCGFSIPKANPHAVSVSLPTIADVIGYEDKLLSVMQKMQTGYPRFYTNRMVYKVREDVYGKVFLTENFSLVPVSSVKGASLINRQMGLALEVVSVSDFDFVKVEKGSASLAAVNKFIQNTGMNPSSRKAEDYLINHGLLPGVFVEESEASDLAESIVTKYLADAYEVLSSDDVILCNTGMNAVYTAYEAVKSVQIKKGRSRFVQLGWLYLDTIEIIKRYSNDQYFQITSNDLDELESWLGMHHLEVAAVFTEVPNNPLIQCLDLPRLRRITQKYDIALVIDATIATPFNMEVLEYCDIVTDSLTKYACGHGDVMMGAIVLNAKSEIALACGELIRSIVERPYIRDVQRLAFTIKNYRSRVEKISANTFALLDYLKHSKIVTDIWSALNPKFIDNFLRVRKSETAMPGLVSILFDKKLHHYYDQLRLPKGPSFGTEFTLAMPYVYLAHFDLLHTPEGRSYLESIGLKPELLRISVGTEPIDEIIRVFEELK